MSKTMNTGAAGKDEYVVAIDGVRRMSNLCQVPQRGNEIMVKDIQRFDPFQRRQDCE